MNSYEKPSVIDYGQLKDLTAANGKTFTVDVPKGTIVPPPGTPFS
jgi:hypothetical protein